MGNEVLQTQDFKIINDPRSNFTTSDLEEQFDLAMKIHAKQMQIYNLLKQLRSVRDQVNSFMNSFDDSVKAKPYKSMAKYIIDTATMVEGKLYNQKIKANEDDLRYPVALGEKLSALKGAVLSADAKPTASMFISFNSLNDRIDVWIKYWKELVKTKIEEFNNKAAGESKHVVEIKEK